MSSRVVLIPCKESHLVQGDPTCAVQTTGGAVLPAQSVKVKTLPEINTFLLALSTAGMSRCLQRCAHGSQPRYLS